MVGKKTECPLPQIRVLNPVTHNTWDEGRYTTYDICIQTHHKSFSLSQTSVRRRFSEFSWLRKQLKSHHTVRTPPDLPPKKFFIQRFDDEFIQKRREGLEQFINSVIREKLYLSDTVLHLFLQTDLTCGELTDFIDGKLTEDFIKTLWALGGKKKVESPVHQPHSDQLLVITADHEDSDLLSGSILSTESVMSVDQNDSTSDACSSSSSNQSDQEEQQSKGDNSIDSGVNLSHVEDSVKDFKRMFSRDFRPSSQFSINNEEDNSSE